MMKRSFSLTAGTLAIAWLTVTAVAADRPLEGPQESFLGKPNFQLRSISREYGRQADCVVALDGTVVVSWLQPGRKGVFEANDGKNVRVRRSEDGGQSWGEEIVIAEGFTGGGTTVDETTGDILAFVEDHHPPAPLTVYRSKDRGKTWAAQQTAIKPDSKGNVPSMHMAEHGITLRHGSHKGRLLRPARHYAGGNVPLFRSPQESTWPHHYNTAIYSDDGGNNWRTSDPFPLLGTGEGTVAELSDGRIYYNSRRHWAPKNENVRRRWTAWSEDGGATWKDLALCKALPDGPQNTDYGCEAGLVRLPIRGRDILLYSNCDNPSRDSDSGDFYGAKKDENRHHGTVWVSFDGGTTWPLKRLAHAGAFCYSSLTAGRPGTPSEGSIYLFFDVHAKKLPVRVARFNLSWLLRGESTGDGTIPEEFSN